MRMSESITALSSALSKAQGEIEGAVKDKQNPAFRSRYADLGAVWDAIRAPLAKHGLSVVQMPHSADPTSFCLVTRLMHSSGEWLEGDYPLNPTKHDPQGYGSAITYARRYALMAVLGVAPEDDDGNAASGRITPPKAEPAKPVISNELKEAANALKARIDAASSAKALDLILKNGAETLDALPEATATFLRDYAAKRRGAYASPADEG